MRFAAYLGLRFLFLIPQIVLISFITFVLVRMLPGNPARMSLGPLAPESAVEALREKWLLDRPIFEQYGAWLEKAFTGDLGESWVNNTYVLDDLIQRIPVTIEIIVLALIMVFLFLVPLAIITAARTKNRIVRFFQNITFGYGMLAGALPDFLLGLVLIFIFFTHAGILPGPEGRLGILDFESPFVTGSVLIDSLIAGDFDNFWSGAWHLIMPVFTLAFVYGAPIFKMLRSQMEGALQADYTIYAEAVGIKPRTVFLRAARVASGPTIVITGVVVMFLLGGAVLVETVFNLTGLGQYAVQSIVTADYAPLQGFVSFAAVFTMLVYLAVDLVQFAMDPRIKAVGSR
ncbi:MAG: ABC transporter permease [Rhodospirillaceae bacterium]|nr:ABC transporter permease [Rhodospirillaceae bacterium]MBT3928465.1 ABC transporter permease [Rhodospirillaceae bacterium]MBT4427340.1 ABC transporter permease [Rhodospirillaceae bacterium]MBT5040472.1 ABC transporter permease [Rhodospirillaceae bacterium]MBT5675008.1 ABC transporter permease [Rhodospirillaceae bacterium]